MLGQCDAFEAEFFGERADAVELVGLGERDRLPEFHEPGTHPSCGNGVLPAPLPNATLTPSTMLV